MKKKFYVGIGFGLAFALMIMYVLFKTIGQSDLVPYQYREFLVLPIILAGGLLLVVGVLIYNTLIKIITAKISQHASSDAEQEYIAFMVQKYGFIVDIIIFIIASTIYTLTNFK